MGDRSSVGDRRVYEADDQVSFQSNCHANEGRTDWDQRKYKQSEIDEADRYKEGKANSHMPQDSSVYS